jgi:ribosomal-protein-alanine N-acetyltransferase
MSMNPHIKNHFSVERVISIDAKELSDLHRQCFDKIWEEDFFLALINNPLTIGLKIQMDGVICGAILLKVDLDEAEVLTLFISSPYQKKGLGARLLDETFKQASINKVFLEVETSNTKALYLYQKCDFKIYNERQHYYGPNRHAALMRWDKASSFKSQS